MEEKGCVIENGCAFFLKLQRDNRQNPLAVDPAKGKIGKRLYFHSTVEMKQPHTLTEP